MTTCFIQLNILIRVGAFRFTGKTKKELLWEGCLSLGEKPKEVNELFNLRPKQFEIPKLQYHNHEDAHDEIELLGFPLCSPFKFLQKQPEKSVLASEMTDFKGKVVTMVGYFVFRKTTKTTKGDLMYFGTFVDEQGDFIDSVHFPQAAKKYPFRGLGIYVLKGTVTEEFDFYSLQVDSMEHLPYAEDKRYD
jgi:DNA polymerase-3 subunit alpha